MTRERVARRGLSGTEAEFAEDARRARVEGRAERRASGSEWDPELEGAGGSVHGRPVRALVWSAREEQTVTWQFEAARQGWVPEGFDRMRSRKLRVELSDANKGRSVEEVLAGWLEASE